MNTNLRKVLWIAIAMVGLTGASFAQLAISVRFGPPPIPVYEQPPIPGDGYLFTPGYWSWDGDGDDYYWVPGTWVRPPAVGVLWTPGWWGFEGAGFRFHEGYWGPRVGFYGGINYGFGYFGAGFVGGRWNNGRLFYNRAVTNVTNVRNVNVYNETVVNRTVNRVSYNGGNGGITARPTPQEQAAASERHEPPVAAQTQQVQAARADRQLRASVNQGKPPVAATAKAGDLQGSAVVPAKQAGGPYKAPAADQAKPPGSRSCRNIASPTRDAARSSWP